MSTVASAVTIARAASSAASSASATVQTILTNLPASAPDDFSKIILSLAAIGGLLATLIIAPWVQLSIAKRSIQAQTTIAGRQVSTQDAIAKRQAADNISAKRQAWIDDTRQDVSRFLGLWASVYRTQCIIHDRKINNKRADTTELERQADTASLDAHETYLRARLRLNPGKSLHQNVVTSMDALWREMNVAFDESVNKNFTPTHKPRLNELSLEIIKHTQIMLREEWLRIKKGEL